VLLWEQANGPIPTEHQLLCLGERSNPDPSNWKLIPKRVHVKLFLAKTRGYRDAPPEIKPSILAVEILEDRVSTKQKRELKPLTDL
jgi:hypothetical protein